MILSIQACKNDVPDIRGDRLEVEITKLIAEYPEAIVAVAVRDSQTGLSLDIRPDRLFHAASTMKIPVMIEVFRQALDGRFSMNDSLVVINDFGSIVDGSRYSIEDDSDDAIYTRLGRPMSIRELVNNMITVSSNLATNLLIDFVCADSVQRTIENLGTRSMRVLRGVEDIKAFRQGHNNTATAADLALLLKTILHGPPVSVDADHEMVEILLDQHFNEMIPEGLPVGTRVAHKTGWITGIHHDAAIVYPDEGEPYVLVILTEGIELYSESAQLGVAITSTVHRVIRPSSDQSSW